MICVTCSNSRFELNPGASGADLALHLGSGWARRALAVRVNGTLRDLDRPLPDHAQVEVITWRDPEAVSIVARSTAHTFVHALWNLGAQPLDCQFSSNESSIRAEARVSEPIDSWLRAREEFGLLAREAHPFARIPVTRITVTRITAATESRPETSRAFYAVADFQLLSPGPMVPDTGWLTRLENVAVQELRRETDSQLLELFAELPAARVARPKDHSG